MGGEIRDVVGRLGCGLSSKDGQRQEARRTQNV